MLKLAVQPTIPKPLESTLSNFSAISRVIEGVKTIRTRPAQPHGSASPRQQPRKGGLSLSKIMLYAPIALEVINLIRQNQRRKQGRFYKARKRDKAFDFILGQANKRLGRGQKQRRGWF